MKKYIILPIMMLLTLVLVACSNSNDIKYVVTFYADGATTELRTQELDQDEKALVPAVPEKEGYEFLFWENILTGEQYNFEDEVTDNLVLVARFERLILDYTVTFDYNYDDLEEEITVTEEQKIQEVPAPSREGYKFLGWYLTDYRFDFNQPITRDIVLEARWDKLSENDLALNFIQTVDFESFLEEGYTLNFLVEMDNFTTPYDPEVPESALGAKINDIKLEVISHFNPDTLFFHNEIKISFKSISFIAHVNGEVVVMDSNWFGSGEIKQTISYKNNNLYSSFNSSIKAAGSNITIAEVLNMAGMFIPGEYGELIDEYIHLLENYEEYKEVDMEESDVVELILAIKTGLNLINNFPEELILNSPYKMSLDNNELTIYNEEDLEFELVILANENNDFNSLTFEIEVEDIPINLTIKTNKPLEEPSFKSYVKVEKLRIEELFD